MESSNQNFQFELEQLIEVIVHALAREKLPAIVLQPSDDLSAARAAFATLTEPSDNRN